MNNRVFHSTAASLAWLSAQLLKIAGEKTDADSKYSRSAARSRRISANSRGLEPEGASMKRPVRRWPQTLGPFMMMILTLRRQGPETECGKRESAALPEGALFVVRYGSR